jgi:release factor glutamine methyltransferase
MAAAGDYCARLEAQFRAQTARMAGTELGTTVATCQKPSMRIDGQAVLAVARELRRHDYSFVTVTPATHARIIARAEQVGETAALTLRDVFGWNKPFERELLPSDMFAWMQRANIVERVGSRFRSRLRFSSLQGRLFAHTSFPTDQADAVFFGPDTYRFCALLQRWAPRAARALDLGCGSGAGGISIADRTQQLVLADVNPRALELAAINAELAGCGAEVQASDLLDDLGGSFDLIVANPPYMRDPGARTYRDGGGGYGEALSVRIVREALPRLNPGGTLIVYTGSAIVDGIDTFEVAACAPLRQSGLHVQYEELDPDVFGEELTQANYERVERIAAVGMRVSVSSVGSDTNAP